MAPSTLEPALETRRSIAAGWAGDEAVFPANRGKLVRLAILGILAEFYLESPTIGTFLIWLNGGAVPGIRAFLTLAVMVILARYVCAWLLGALFARPHLTATVDGIVLLTLFGRRKLAWTSLSPFELRSFVLPTGRQVFRATARILEADATGSWFARKTITLGDAFARPLPGLVDALNSRRSRLLQAAGFHAQAAEQPQEENLGLASFGEPVLSYAILLVLLGIFFLELRFAVDSGPILLPSYATLMAMGALAPLRVVYDGEWYRLLTAPLLHGTPDHIINNCVALLWGGRVLERLVGRLWYLAILLLGALGGSLASLALQSPYGFSVGASGALMAVFAAILVIGFRVPRRSALRHSLHVLALWMMVPAILPYFLGRTGDHIDYAAHLGGALTGAAMGLVLLDLWPQGERIPRRAGVAAGICAVGMILVIASVVIAVIHYQTYDITLIPVEGPGG